jgi:hypothetical protein
MAYIITVCSQLQFLKKISQQLSVLRQSSKWLPQSNNIFLIRNISNRKAAVTSGHIALPTHFGKCNYLAGFRIPLYAFFLINRNKSK